MALPTLFLRQEWWNRNRDMLLNPDLPPRHLNLAALVDPWPGTLEQFRALFYREAREIGLRGSTKVINEFLVIVAVARWEATEAVNRERALLRKDLSSRPAIADEKTDCTCETADGVHAPSCRVWW